MSSSVHDSVVSGLNYSCQPSRTNLSSEGSRMSSFNDPRFVHNIAKLVGSEVEVVTTTGDHLKGILDTFSDEFAVALKSVQELVPNGSSELKSVPYVRNEISSHTVIVPKDYLVSLTADEVKQDCEKKPFLDAGISSLLNGTHNKNGNATAFVDRDFVPWEAEFSASSLEVSLEEGGAGWDSEFMLESFEKSNPGKTSYKGMEQYTNVEVPQNLNEEEVKEIENFVESCSRTSDDYHEDESDDRPEEEKFAAVIREEEPKPTSSEIKRSPSISRCSVDSQASQRSVKYRTSTHSRQWVNSSGTTNMLQNRSSDYQWGSIRRGGRPYQRYPGSRRGRNRGGTTKRNSPPTSHQHSVKYNVSGEQGLNYYSDRDFKPSYSGRPSLPLTSTGSPPNKGVRSSPSSDTTRISRTSSRRGSPVEKPSRYCGRPSLPTNVSGNKETYDSLRRPNHKQIAYRNNRGSYEPQKGSDRKPAYKTGRSRSRDTENLNEGATNVPKKSDNAEEPTENTTILVSSPQSEPSAKFSTPSRSVTPETSSDLAAKVAHSNLNPLACVFIPHGSANISEVNSPSPSRPNSISTPQVGAVIPQIITGQQNYFATPAQIASPAAMNLVRAQGSKKAIVSVHTPVIENPIPSIHPAAYTPSFQHPAAFPNMRYVLISEPVQQEQETPGTTPQYSQGSSSGAPTPVPQLVMFGNQPYPMQYSDMIGQPYNPQGSYYIVNPNSAPPYPQIVPCQLAPLNAYPTQHIPPSVAHSLALQQPQFYHHSHLYATPAPAPQTPFIVSSSSANTNSVTVQVPPLSQPPVHPQTTS